MSMYCYCLRRSVLPALLLFVLLAGPLAAQDSKDFAVMLSADVQSTPTPRITIRWNADPFAGRYLVWRREKGAAVWSINPIAQLDSGITSYVDDDVEIGVGYEYQVFKNVNRKIADTTVFGYQGTGYIYAGIERAPETLPGKVLLLVDNTMAAPLKPELDRLAGDLESEGWIVVRQEVPRTEAFNGAAVVATKAMITAEYAKAPKNLTAVFLIGRVAVPYAGRVNPDGHPDHRGAWPADVYYADMRGNWTDTGIRDTSAGRPQNKNVPGDGKFDQSSLPAPVTLAVGRVDFYDMPGFEQDTEVELLRKYLNKDHAFRTGAVPVVLGGIVDDNFSAAAYGEAFASGGWRNMSVFGGESSVKAGDWFGSLGGDATYLWAYGCGGGSYMSAGGVGTITDFATKPTKAIFTMLFGSYFGDWDVTNSFLRSSLAGAGTTLTCAWVARPQWYFHHMALGETIGYSTIISENNGTSYIPNLYFTTDYPDGLIFTFGNAGVHMALLGDPTLRAQMSTIPAPGPLTVSRAEESSVRVAWGSASGNVAGYFVYRAPHPDSAYRLLNLRPVTGTEYIDEGVSSEQAFYIVRSAVLRHTASGSWYDAGRGVAESIRLSGVDDALKDVLSMSVAPNPMGREASVVLTLPVASHAVVSVHDMNGDRVRELYAGAMSQGRHTIPWDGTDDAGVNVPSGQYVLVVETPVGSRIEKMIVAR